MSKVLVFIEHSKNLPKRSSLELISAAASSGGEVHVVVFGSNASEVASELPAYGAHTAHLVKDPQLDRYNSELFTEALNGIVEKVQPAFILGSSSACGRDFFPRLAAKLKSGLISDAVSISISGETMSCVKPMYSGKCLAKVDFQNSPFQIALIRPNQLPINEPDRSKTGSIVEHSLEPLSLRTVIQNIVKGTSEKLDLTEAKIIISGGRGLKEAANFKILNDLADVLGATVGASRAVVDAGWVDHGMQVGQTGKTVAPALYIAVGISGAIQHLAGMSGSKVIVAVNNDASAPIFQKATYGIVGDALEVIPMLTEEFKKTLQH